MRPANWRRRISASLCVAVALSITGGPAGAQAPDPDVRRLSEILENPAQDTKAKIAACEELLRLGSEAAPAVPALVKLAAADDDELRAYAALAMAQIGAPAVPALEKLLSDEDRRARMWAAVALGRIGPPARKAVPGLIAAARDAQSRETVSSALQNIGSPAIPHLIGVLEDRDAELRAWGATTIAAICTSDPYPRARPAVRPLAKLLADDAPAVRREAARALGAVGDARHAGALSKARVAVPALIERLEDPDVEVRTVAAHALSRIEHDAEPAVPALVDRVADGREPDDVKIAAAWALMKIAPPPGKTTLAAFSATLKDPSPDVRLVAASALARIAGASEETVRTLVDAMLSGTAELAPAAPTALAQIGAPAVRPLLARLEDDDRAVRLAVTQTLAEIGPEAEAAVPALIGRLKQEKDEQVARALIDALGRIQRGAKHSVPALAALLKHEDYNRQTAACEALGRIGPAAAEAVPELIEQLRTGDLLMPLYAANALGEIGPAAREAAPDLAALLRVESTFHQAVAAETLRKVGGVDNAAREKLRSLLKSGAIRVRLEAARTLWHLDPSPELSESVVPVLIEGLGSDETEDRLLAAEGLRIIGPPARESVPALLEAHGQGGQLKLATVLALRSIGPRGVRPFIERLRSDDETVRFSTLLGFVWIGPAAEEAVPHVIAHLDQPDAELRWRAMNALGSIGPRAKEAVPKVIERLSADEDVEVRVTAATTLGHIGLARPEVIRALSGALKDPDAKVSEEAAAALAWLGPEAKDAVPSLVEVVDASQGIRRLAAAFALARIRRDHPRGVPVLIEGLEDPHSRVATQAAIDLRLVGPAARKATAGLAKLLKSPHREVRSEAVHALGWIAPDDSADVLREALADPAPQVRRHAAIALSLCSQPVARDAVDDLRRARAESDAESRHFAEIALLKLGCEDDGIRRELNRAVPQMMLRIEEARRIPRAPDSPRVAAYWIGVLGRLRSEARLAVPVLERIAEHDPDPDIRKIARDALERVRAERRPESGEAGDPDRS